MPEEVTCNLCGRDDTRTLYVLRDYRLQVDDVEWRVVQCRHCGLGYLNPRPTHEEVARYYPKHYFAHRGKLQDRYRRQAAYLSARPGRVLDIGAARGDFLATLKDLGWEVEGIEPFDTEENPHDIPIHRIGFPEESELPGESFDAITAWAVFEHLHDPARAFAESARLLRPGGSLIVQVPNLRSIHGRLAPLEDVPRHLYFFSPRSLESYGRSAGLSVDRVEHVTDLFSGASGREALRYWAARALGKSTRDFFRIYRTPRGERFRRWPFTSVVLAGTGLVGRVLIPDRLVRAARISGQIVVVFKKPVVSTPS